MMKIISCLAFIVLFIAACHKDKAAPEPPVILIPDTPKVVFVFVNRIGFRNDSTRHGVNDTVFQGPCMDAIFYDKKVNISYFLNTCYNRNYFDNRFATSDSIIFGSFNSAKDNKHSLQVELVWKCPKYPYTTKVLRYNTINFNVGDTIKVPKDTVIKFIWPLDTASGKYQLTYQWP